MLIRPEEEKELYAYIGGIIKQNNSYPIKINGVGNHVHVLSTLSKNLSFRDEYLKFLQEYAINFDENYYGNNSVALSGRIMGDTHHVPTRLRPITQRDASYTQRDCGGLV